MKLKIWLLIIILCFIPTISNSSSILDEHIDNLIYLCEQASCNDREALLYCIIAEFYAAGKVDDIYNSDITFEEWQKLGDLLKKFYIPKPYDTYDFVEIHLQYEKWKKEGTYENETTERNTEDFH